MGQGEEETLDSPVLECTEGDKSLITFDEVIIVDRTFEESNVKKSKFQTRFLDTRKNFGIFKVVRITTERALI